MTEADSLNQEEAKVNGLRSSIGLKSFLHKKNLVPSTIQTSSNKISIDQLRNRINYH